MMFIDIIKIMVLLICCSMAAWSDLKEGIISNQLVVPFIIIGVLLDVITIALSPFLETKLFVINGGSLIIIAFLLYFLKVWAGGDCKLLIIVALLYPSALYWRLDSASLTLWYSLGFMFGTGFIYLIIESIILSIREKRKIFTKDAFISLNSAIKQYARTLVFMSALSQIYLFFIYSRFKIPTPIFSVVCIVYIWILHSINLFQSNKVIVFFLLFDVMMTVFTGNITISTMWTTYVVVVTFLIVRLYISRYNYKVIDTSDIKKGMILSRMSSLLMQNSRVKGLPKISDESLGSRISEEEAKSIIRWSKTKKGCAQVTIIRKMPFAVFITSGILLYMVFRGVLQ